jgi:acetyl-CoA carboxylase biotin carboxyl carrier protein
MASAGFPSTENKMGSTKTKASRPSKSNDKHAGQRLLNLTDIRALAKMVNQYDLSELELENGAERLRIRRDRSGVPVAVAPQVELQSLAPAPAPVSPATPARAEEEEKPDDGSVLITSPFVGTFYRSPSPETPPFVEVDQKIKKGQVLCIVEAMKLMNEIEAETDCTILEILVKNSEPVEFGQPLFRVFPVA